MTQRKERPQKLGDALARFLDQAGLTPRIEQAAIITEWEAIVGPQIAAVTAAQMVSRDGTLFVAVTTNAWMQELSLMEPQLLTTINARLAKGKIAKIRWQLMRR